VTALNSILGNNGNHAALSQVFGLRYKLPDASESPSTPMKENNRSAAIRALVIRWIKDMQSDIHAIYRFVDEGCGAFNIGRLIRDYGTLLYRLAVKASLRESRAYH
jgi:hypothetical protein